MIPQIGFAEMLVIAILALVVVGPKDLPGLMRKAGQFVGKMKMMGQEFKSAFDEIGQEDELDDLRREIEELKAMGQMSNLSDEAFEEDMRALDRDLNDVTDFGTDGTNGVDTQTSDKPDAATNKPSDEAKI